MPSRSEEITAFIIMSVILANCLTALAVWYEIYYYIDDNGPETIKAILLDAAAAAAVTILFMGTVNIMMLLSNYVLDQYRRSGTPKPRSGANAETMKDGGIGTTG